MSNPNRTKPWTIHQLREMLGEDLTQCQTALERANVRAIGGKEIREKATEWSKIRKLTPGEIAIAQEFGWNG